MFAIEYCRGGGNWHSLINFYCDFLNICPDAIRYLFALAGSFLMQEKISPVSKNLEGSVFDEKKKHFASFTRLAASC